MISVDDLHAILDRDPEVTVSIDDTIKNIKAGEVVSLEYYRHLMKNYKGWKPLELEDYVSLLNGSRYAAAQLELELQRREDNDKVSRKYGLPKKPKKD